MAISISYTKSAIQQYRKNLQVRQKALPVLLRKETALRQVVAGLNPVLLEKRNHFEAETVRLEAFESIWSELPLLVKVKRLHTSEENIAGSRVRNLDSVEFEALKLNPLFEPAWMPSAIEALQDYIQLKLELQFLEQKLKDLKLARKKTTQKVNLYEKVQIPAFENAILSVKRFLEDKENISTAAKKIAKNRQSQGL